MSESIVRKVQPFTIRTRLSVSGPATRSKGPDFPQQSGTLGNITLQTNLHDRVSLYLSQVQVCMTAPHLVPLANRTTPTPVPVKQQHEDHRNQNAMSESRSAVSPVSVSPTTASRSIRKITISGSPEEEDSSWRRQEESDHRVVIEKEDSSWRRQEESDHRVVIEKEDSSWRRQEESDHRVVIEKEDSSWRRQEESDHRVVIEKEDSSWRRQEESDHRVVIEKEDSSWRRQEESDHRVVIEKEDSSWRRQEESDHRVVIEKEDSSWRRQEESDHRVVSIGPGRPPITGTPRSENIIINNNNNNNNISSSKPQMPRILGVTCENKASSHFKDHGSVFEFLQTLGPRARSPRKDRDAVTVVVPQNDSYTQCTSLFNQEVLQAEMWIVGKQQELKEGCNIQRDLKDFENTFIQLNQTGEVLNSKLNPSSDLVKKQLSQLRDQWQALKQTAANQHRALGGTRNLEEFNRKVDKLEAWIKEKEEEQSLMKVLGENTNKLHLTRKVLDLKQDEQLYRTLHEEINHLALKLEKQGRAEGKNISTRRKHVNKMWLKVHSLLKDYHENLQLALEVSSFYQQADNTLSAIKNMDLESSGGREIRGIASQIMMLDVTVSQLSNLHPVLTVKVTQKQTEVKDCWSLLQKVVRNHGLTPSPLGSRTTLPPSLAPSPLGSRITLPLSLTPSPLGSQPRCRPPRPLLLAPRITLHALLTPSPLGSQTTLPPSLTPSPLGSRTTLPPSLTPSPLGSRTTLPPSLTPSPLGSRTTQPPSLAPSPLASGFTREDGDSLTQTIERQGSVGTEPHRIMEKEVKEEQNRLKGCMSLGHYCGPAPSPLSHRACMDDVIIARKDSDFESRTKQSGAHPQLEPRLQPEATPSRQGQPKLRLQIPEPYTNLQSSLKPRPYYQMQLQKFTVSADKTLSWLKDNVAMATQVCSIAVSEGLMAARKCQDILEQEIIDYSARTEVVKKEGRGLIRAQHPGSSNIQEFLIRLEELWEELRRRHHRNQVYLQAGEDMSFRRVQLLQALGSIEAWLEAVELSMSNSQLAGDTETVRLAEREICLLQTELSSRGMELAALRQEMDRLGGQQEGQGPGYPNTEGLPDYMDQVERKYQRVQTALTQQSSSLQDTRMLTEFLERVEVELEERVELEESQEARGRGYSSNLGQPLHSEIISALSLLGDGGGSGGGEPLMELLGNPVQELQEAVEMLNDTVRERGRSQNHIHDQAIQTVIGQLAVLSVRVEDCLCCSRELNLDLLQRETDMALCCEQDDSGLEGLEEQQHHLEVDYAVLKEEVEELQRQAGCLEELCPERVSVLGVEVQGALGVWRELGKNVEENRDRLRQFVHLQDFFRTYLAMISWMEDTRECIFSERVLHCGRDGQEPVAAEMEMDVQIDRKLEEFEELVAAGRNLLNAEHHLANMIRERLEELKSMLGWILVHWRDQKHQRSLRRKKKTESNEDIIYSQPPTKQTTGDIYSTRDNIYSESTVESTRDNIYTNTVPESIIDNIYVNTKAEPTAADTYTYATACSPDSTPAQPETHHPPTLSVFEDRLRTIDSLSCWEDLEEGYQVMSSSTRPPGDSGFTSPPETHQYPGLVFKEPSRPALCLECTSVNSSPGVSLVGQWGMVSPGVSLVGQGGMVSPGVSLVGQGGMVSPGVSLVGQGGMVSLGGTVKTSLGGSVDLGGTINLILSLGNHGDSHVEVLEASPRVGEEEESTEPVHRPSKSFWRRCQVLLENTLGSLKRKIYRQSADEDNNMTSAPVYESVLLPRFHTKTSSSSSPSSSSSSSGPPHPDVSISSSLPRSTSFFSSLKRRSRKRDPSRHTIQRIMFVEGEEQTEVACPAEAAPQPITLYETQTWPTKEGRRKKKSQLKAEGVGPGQGVKLMDYMDNPLARDIDDECSGVYTVSPYAVTEAVSLAPPTGQVRSHCRFLSLGSVLTFDLPKDMRLVPSIQDIITIGPPEHRGTPNPETHTALSSFKQTRSPPSHPLAGPPSSKTQTCSPTSPPSDTHRTPDNEAVTTDRHETMTQTLTQPQIQTQPLLTQPQIQKQPLLTQPQIQTQTLLTQPQIQTQPLLTQPQIQTQPLLTQPQIQTQPLLTQPQIQTQPLTQTPTQILKQTKPLTQAIQLEPLFNLDKDFPLPPPLALDEDWDQNGPSDDLSLSQIQTIPSDDLSLSQIQTEPSDDLSLSQIQFSVSGIVSLHQESEQEWAELVSSKQPPITAYVPKSPVPKKQDHYNYMERAMVSRSPVVKNKYPCPSSAYQNHESKDPCPSSAYQNQESKDPCPSSAYQNHECLIQDLNGHQYHQRLKTHRESLDLQKTSQASQMVVNLKTSGSGSMREDAIDSGISGVSNSGRLKLNATDVSQEPKPKRTVMGRLVSLEVVSKPRADPAAAPAPAHPEKETPPRNKHPDHQTETDLDSDPVHPDPNLIIHPDHQQFEESEEELEDIWNHSDGYRQSISSDIMYQPHQEEEEGGSSNTPGLTTDTQNQAQPQAPPYRKLITASAPNLLVAEFTLPSSFQTLLGYNQGQNQDQGFSRDPDPREEIPTLANRDRRSWAAFPNQDQPWRTTALVNETAADPVKLPEIEDQKRYIYQYREEEEEEEDEEEKMEDTYCPKDTSMSLRCVDMGLDRANQRARSCGTLEGVMEKQNGSGSELQRMEGTLERKHKLQLGGKKSCGLSVNLTGAECVPAPEYTKKPQCFSLRLRDGSEYLLNTASRFMMKKWMVKIQANTVPSEHVSSMTSPSSPLVQDPPSPVTTSSLSRSPHTGTARAKEIVVLTRETYPQIRQWHPGKQPDPTSSSHTGSREDNYDPLRQSPFSLHTSSSIPPFSLHSSVSPPSSSTVSRGGQDWLSQVNKHRSHSFTSARYQKIKPVLLAPGRDYGSVGLGRDCGSNYSVTLVIGDKRSDASPTISCDGSGPSNTEPHHPLLDGWQQHSCHQHQATYHHYQDSDQQDPSLRACTSLPRPRKKSVFKKFFGKKD
ncbi:uncharacterized protein LOC121561532 [Coregonus clupeaformis]|uniref:uncharacterized protein LOC121561532 n=1 Tax=Coregonus clupeaformis TaxID=59861 RepID=UPI001E1C7B74|nr:uncharacterized protein LOC121561532 [Coregonus clupeaformis]